MVVDYLLSVWFKMFRFCLLLCCVFFSFFVFAGDCVEVDGRFQLRFNGDGDGGCSSSDGLVIYSNAVSSNVDFLRANNDGFTVSLTFDRDADALVPGDDIILFGVYGDYAASVVLMEVGIKSNGELFYNHPDEKFSRLLTDDVAMVNPHSLVISYSENERVVRVMVDGREITQSNVDAIDVDVRRITIGENFSGRMAPITGFDRRFTVSERFYESDRLSNVYNVPVIPLDVVDGVKRSEGLCLDDQVGQDKVCLLAANVLSSAPFSNFRTPDGATIDPPKSGSVETFLSCDPGYTPSDPAPSYIVDSNGDITFNGGSCTLDQCNVINIPAYFSTITSPLSYGSNQLFTCDAGYVGSTSLNCTDGSTIDMSGNTDCILTGTADFSDAVDGQILQSSGFDTIEGNIMIWLDANDNSTVTYDNYGISQWLDKSGNNNNATQTDNNFKPSYNVTDNGNVSFGIQDFMNIPVFTGGLTSGEMFAVVKLPNTNRYSHFHRWGPGTPNHPHYSNGSTIYENFGRNSRYSFAQSTNLTQYHIYNLSAATSDFYARLNGGEIHNVTSGAISWGSSNEIGRSADSWAGNIQELIFFSGNVSDSDRYKINYYLSKKWGLEADVDSDADGTVDNSDFYPMDPHNGLNIIFSDNFNDNSASWTTAALYDGFDFRETRGELFEGTGNGMGYAKFNMGENSSLAEYSISVDVKPYRSGTLENNGIGIVFNETNVNNNYRVRWHDYSTNYSGYWGYRDLELIKRTNGRENVLVKIDALNIAGLLGQPIDTNFSFTLTVDVTNSGISVKVNGLEQITHSDQPNLGNIGLWTDDNDKDISYDNLIISTP